MIKKIRDHYASERGLIRLLLAHFESAIGRTKEFEKVDFQQVERLVFVCLGNICRSPFGEFIAQRDNVPTAGFGLSTTTGIPAFDLGIQTAKLFDIDMESHRTTDITDFEIKDTDLLLVMEVRHAVRLKQLIGSRGAQIALLGHWAHPRRLHIHDPHIHDPTYFRNCYNVIKNATELLVKEYKMTKNTGTLDSNT